MKWKVPCRTKMWLGGLWGSLKNLLAIAKPSNICLGIEKLQAKQK